MYTYKRGMDDIKKAKNVEFVMSNNLDICLCSSAILDMKKPYNGLYIKNGKVILERLKDDIREIEKFIANNKYIIAIGTTGSIFGKEIELLEDNKIVKGLDFFNMYSKERNSVIGDDIYFSINDRQERSTDKNDHASDGNS